MILSAKKFKRTTQQGSLLAISSSGTIVLSPLAAEMLGVEDKDKIVFYLRSNRLFIMKDNDSPDGFRVRKYFINKDEIYAKYEFSCKALAAHILNALDCKSQKMVFTVSDERDMIEGIGLMHRLTP